jgi:biopolymer transport protein ExbD
MRKSKVRNKGEAPKLEMTPMIDVVFQLLIFFLVTLKQEDILSKLEVSRPAPETRPPPEVPPDLLTITVYKDGYVLQGRRVSLDHLDRQLTRLAQYSKKLSVVIKCTGDSPHRHLVKLLDVCAKADLKNLSVFSM